MYLTKTPSFVQSLFPNYIWKIDTLEKKIFLTFDDGPIPEVTPLVLDILEDANAKATFFCVGDNVKKYPDIFDRIKAEGHSIGSHTFNHLNGWNTDNIAYFHNVREAASLTKSELFRPPYGRLKPKQSQFLLRHYKIIMWDVLSADFDQNISPESCLNNVLNNAAEGSIVVFHDSLKAKENMLYALPRTLEYFSNHGFVFSELTTHDIVPELSSPIPVLV